QERRRAAAQVDSDVPDLAAQAMDQLLLGVRRPLEVKAANAAALARSRVVDLRDWCGPTRLGELVGTEQTGEEAARITEAVSSDALQAGERRFLDDEAPHSLRPAPGEAVTTAPTASGVASWSAMTASLS